MRKHVRSVGATLFIIATVSLGILADQSSSRIDIEVGVSIHGIVEYNGSLLINDWRTGELYHVSWDGIQIRRDALSIPRSVCDIVIEGHAAYVIDEAGEEVIKYSLTSRVPLERIAVPEAAGVVGFDIQGMEKDQDLIYLLGSDLVDAAGQHTHIIGVFDVRNGYVDAIYSYESPAYSDLVGLQWFNGELWTFDYSSGWIVKIIFGEGSFHIENGMNVFSDVLSVNETASGGLRGFYMYEGGVVLSSISGHAQEASLVHIAELP